jgi:hypothetical protein
MNNAVFVDNILRFKSADLIRGGLLNWSAPVHI